MLPAGRMVSGEGAMDCAPGQRQGRAETGLGAESDRENSGEGGGEEERERKS